MDGTLVNTEDLYTLAATRLLAEFGKGPLTWDVKIHLQGRPGPEATKRVIAAYNIPISPEEFMERAFQIQQGLWKDTEFLPGALELVQYLKAKNVPIALGTSSNTKNYHLKTTHLKHGFDLFEEHVVRGDSPLIPPGKGKPHPHIWLACLESINSKRRLEGHEDILIEECLIFEDGLPGVESGVNANATVIWIPHPEARPLLKDTEQETIGEKGEILDAIGEFDKEKYGF